MFCAAACKLSQKRGLLEGSKASKPASMDVKHPYAQAERCPLDLVINMSGQRCHFLPHSQRFGGLHNGGTIGEWLGGIVGGIVTMLM